MAILEVTVTDHESYVVLQIKGEARMDLSALERQTLRLAARKPALLILDLSELDFMSSLAMGSLVALRRGITTHGGTVKIAGPKTFVLESLRHANLHTLFTIVPTMEEALAANPA